MARGVNKVILIGHLGDDPDVRFMPNGKAVANIRLATSESWKDRQTGEKQERTEWHSVVLYEKSAEIAGEYLHKGSQIYLEGSLRTRKWQDKEGKDRWTTEIVARNFNMLGGRGTNGGDAGGERSASAPRQSSKPQNAPRQPEEPPHLSDGFGGDDGGFDQEIPF